MKIHIQTYLVAAIVLLFVIVTYVNTMHPFDVFGYHVTGYLPAISVLLIGWMFILHEHRHQNNKPPKP